jgi:hypothetical protein
MGEPVMTDDQTQPAVDRRKLDRVWRCFDGRGRLQRWPSKRSEQILVLWIVWSQLPKNTQFTELEVKSMLAGWHDLEDHALLRRDLVDLGLLRRTPNGAVYRCVNAEVPPDAATAIAGPGDRS